MATMLKMLLAERHLKSHSDFLAAYDKCAAQLDPPVPPGHGPGKAQYYQWLSGRMIGLPRDYHCRVLAQMFPEWTVEALFRDAEPVGAAQGTEHRPQADDRLHAFLGAEMVAVGATLVYPTFELKETPISRIRRSGVPGHRTFRSRSRVAAAEHHGHSPIMLAENHIRGLLHVLCLLQRHTRITTEIRSDRDIAGHLDRPYISFGLSGNDRRHLYLHKAARSLFTLRVGRAGDGHYSEHVQLADGRRYHSHGDRDIGLVARVRPSPDRHPDRYWIFCAGLGEHGTAGAGWYLATSWSRLQQRAGDHEFVAVIGVRDRCGRTADLEHLLIESA